MDCASTGEIVVSCLGHPTVTRSGETMALRSQRAVALVAYLACARGPAPRAVLAEAIWPDSDPATARGNLRATLSHLRRLDGLLDVTRTTVQLADGPARHADVRRFDALAGRALRRSRVADAADLLERAWSAWGGELLEGIDLDLEWLDRERTRLRLTAVRVLEGLVDAHLLDQLQPRTLQLTHELVDLAPYREASVARRMRALWRAGDSAEALRCYEQAVARFADDLQVTATDDLHDLATWIRAGRTDESAPSGPQVGARLPPARELVGRDEDRRRLEEALERSRLVTVTGPGGVGKTSLALAHAHATVAARRGSVRYVDLVDVEVDAVERVIADALAGERDGEAEPGAAARDDTLVLDNFEHLVVAAPALTAILEGRPGLTILVTSRSDLRLSREVVVPLGSLDVDETTDDPPPAVRLFLERATEHGVHLPTDEQSLRQVAEVCRLVDGLPLAIELAAGRLRMLGLAGLLGALHDDAGRRLEVLGGGPTDGPRRHRTAHDAIAWSHDLLEPRAQRLLRRFSVLAGSADLEAVQSVCGGEDLPRAEIVDLLAELVSLHLVAPVRSGASRSRFRLLQTTQAFAASRLREAGSDAALRDRHAAHFAARARDRLRDRRGLPWLDRVDDLANHTAACRWFVARGRHDRARQLLADLGPAFRFAGRAEIGLALHDEIRRGPENDRALAAECAIWRAGLLAETRPRDAAAPVTTAIESSLPRLTADTDPLRRARALAEAVRILSYVGATQRATELAGVLRSSATDIAEREWELGARWEVAWIAHRQGDDATVDRILRELIPEAIELGNRRVELYGWMLADLAGIDRTGLTSDPPGLHDLLDMSVELDDHRYATWLMVSLGAVATIEQRLDDAATHFRRALRLADEMRYEVGLGFCLLGVVGICGFSGDVRTAVRLHAALDPHLPALHPVLPRAYREAYEAVVAMLVAAAEQDDTLTAVWREGAQLTLRDAAGEAWELLERLAS